MMKRKKKIESNFQRLEKLKGKFFETFSATGPEEDLARLFIFDISMSLAELDFIGKEAIESFWGKLFSY